VIPRRKGFEEEKEERRKKVKKVKNLRRFVTETDIQI
jgi:hypothetical protein